MWYPFFFFKKKCFIAITSVSFQESYVIRQRYKIFHLSRTIIRTNNLYDQCIKINCENTKFLSTINFKMKGKNEAKEFTPKKMTLNRLFITLLHVLNWQCSVIATQQPSTQQQQQHHRQFRQFYNFPVKELIEMPQYIER